jgi:hypothetical protein
MDVSGFTPESLGFYVDEGLYDWGREESVCLKTSVTEGSGSKQPGIWLKDCA